MCSIRKVIKLPFQDSTSTLPSVHALSVWCHQYLVCSSSAMLLPCCYNVFCPFELCQQPEVALCKHPSRPSLRTRTHSLRQLAYPCGLLPHLLARMLQFYEAV